MNAVYATELPLPPYLHCRYAYFLRKYLLIGLHELDRLDKALIHNVVMSYDKMRTLPGLGFC